MTVSSIYFFIAHLNHYSLLQAALSNGAIHVLLRRDMLSKIQLDYELWCPLSEAFAPHPFAAKRDDETSQLAGCSVKYPNPISKDHLKKCQESRAEMQEEILGFVPQSRLVLPSAKDYQWKKAAGRNFFKELSSAMKDIYDEEYAVSDEVWLRREKVRAAVEHIVSTSGEFPAGTKVAVFGSSANGFG